LLTLKDRSQAKGLIIIASDISQIVGYINEEFISDEMWERAKATWPGPYTWIMPAKASLSPLLTGEHDTIAVRVTAHPDASQLCRQFAKPVVSTSANIAGQPPARSVQEVQQQFHGRVKCIVAGEVDASISPTEIRDLLTNTVLRKSS
jgi:L-threonylcarbamoyladenylate synthase